MKSTVKRRQRVLHARKIQHLQAAGVAAAAEGMVTALEAQAAHVLLLSHSMVPATGATTAAAIGGAGELAMRLRDAHTMLGGALERARADAEDKAAFRVEARIREESADRLVDRARAALSDANEMKLQLMPLARRRGGLA